jgi:hypothetical protein
LEELLGLVGVKYRKTLLKFAFRFLYFDDRLGPEDLSALLAESGVTIVLAPASVTFDRGNRLGLLLGDVFPMQRASSCSVSSPNTEMYREIASLPVTHPWRSSI